MDPGRIQLPWANSSSRRTWKSIWAASKRHPGGRGGRGLGRRNRYSLLSGPEGERVLVLLIKWDSFEDSGEFFQAYEVFAGIKMQEDGGNSESVGQSGRKWVMPERTIFLGQIGPVIMLIIGDNEPRRGRAGTPRRGSQRKRALAL